MRTPVVKEPSNSHQRQALVNPAVIQPSRRSLSSGVLQRKPSCACGGGCPRCQTKLNISEPGDKYEQEADSLSETLRERIADQVMRMPEPSVQRQVEPEEEEMGGQTPRRSPGTPLPYREAMEATERFLYEEYLSNCKEIRVLERLERKEISPLERVKGLERRLRVIPHLFEAKRQIEQEEDTATRQQDLRDFQESQVEGEFPKFPKGYVLSSEENELAIAQCELSRAEWEFFVSTRRGRIPGRRSLPRRFG
jgi:hypothetical protein